MGTTYLRIIAVLLATLIASLPICFADQINLIHDKNGNLVTGDGLYREYNDFNQLTRIRNGSLATSTILEELVYHPTEERVLIKDVFNNSGDVAESVYYFTDEFVRVVNRTGSYDTVYVKVDGQLVAQKNPDGSKYFIHNDHLGSASIITDQNGDAIENSSYSPFGEILSGGSKSRFSYTGQEFDSVLGDFDYHARRYAAWLGQFVQPDTSLLPYNPQALNRYSFTLNNPYKYIDPDGKIPSQDQAGTAEKATKFIKSVEAVQEAIYPEATPDETLQIVSLVYEHYYEPLSDKQSSEFSPMFVYTGERGIIDLRHFFKSADFVAQGNPEWVVKGLGYGVEISQLIKKSESRFTYEDLRSNRAGREFGRSLDRSKSLSEQFDTFMQGLGANEFPNEVLKQMPLTKKNYVSTRKDRSYTENGKALPSGTKNSESSGRGICGITVSCQVGYP